MSSLPFYTVQKTSNVPFNATSDDVKAAIENLSPICKVEVARYVDENGYSWDVSFSSSQEEKLSANGAGLKALVAPYVTVVGLQEVKTPVLLTGIPYFVRMSAKNNFGTGLHSASNPLSMQPSTQPPGLPREFFVEALSDSEMLVQWESPSDDGGEPVTHYWVECDTSVAFDR